MNETRFEIVERWPELFESLDAEQQRSVVQAFAASWHEGWIPDRDEVELLTLKVSGAIDRAEYQRRGWKIAHEKPGVGDSV